MPGINVPDDFFNMMKDFDRRLRAVENGARLGWNLRRAAFGAIQANATTFGSWEFGPAGTNYVDESGQVQGNGYPQITLQCGGFVSVEFGGQINNIGNDSLVFKSIGGGLSVFVDGVQTVISNGMQNNTNQAISLYQVGNKVLNLQPGSHTFALAANWNNSFPGAATPPYLGSCWLIVTPYSTR